MYGKALLFVILVVVGAVLPYLLSDEKFVGKVNDVFSGASDTNEVANTAPTTSKPTTAGKIVTVPASPKSVPGYVPSATYPPVGSLASGSPSSLSGYAPGLNPGLTAPVAIQSNGTKPRTTAPSQTSRLAGPRNIPIEHLLSFEVTPAWVAENWSRVTTRLSDLALQGWRVPVVLNDTYDLVGSVTYLFDRQNRVQRITLHGFTQNPNQLVLLATSRYQMRRIPNFLTELYLHVDGNRPLGGLKVTNSTIRKTRGKSEILMELNRQDSAYGMSYEFEEAVRSTHERDQILTPLPAEIDRSDELSTAKPNSRPSTATAVPPIRSSPRYRSLTAPSQQPNAKRPPFRQFPK